MKRPAIVMGIALLGALPIGMTALAKKAAEKKQARYVERSPGKLQISEKTWPTLRQALDGSIRYYKARPAGRKFPHGKYNKTAREQIRALEIFTRLTHKYKGAKLEREIQKRFRFLESVNTKGDALFTGYYDPLMDVRHKPDRRFNTPVYGRPGDLIEVNLADFARTGEPSLASSGPSLKGRLKAGRLTPYYARREIVNRKALKLKARLLFYANDVDLHFFQLQGGGLVRAPKAKALRLAYAGDNGHKFNSLYARLKGKCEYTRRGIKRYLLNRPALRQSVMNENPRYIFFKKTKGDARGDIGVPLTPGHSLAMDPRIIPRGALVYLRFSPKPGAPVQSRFALVQDRGSAILGHGRADLYFGAGNDAEKKAWGFQTRGRIFLLVAR